MFVPHSTYDDTWSAFSIPLSDADIPVSSPVLATRTGFGKILATFPAKANGDNNLGRIPATRRYRAQFLRCVQQLGIPYDDTKMGWRKDTDEYGHKLLL